MTKSTKTTPTSSGAGDDAGQAEVQAKFDEAAEKGYFGTAPDDTPLENYTLSGVNAGKPTPETERGK
jgi:hypothetical protein